MNYNHYIETPVRFTDIDLLGHVSNSSYSAVLDDGRVSYFKTVNEQSFDLDNICLVLLNLNLMFHHPAHIFDILVIGTKTISIGTKSMRMKQEIRRKSDDLLICSAESIMVGFNKRTETSQIISDEWVEKLEAFEKTILKTQTLK